MKIIDKELFFVIDEKNNTIELTGKGIDLISGNDDREFFIMPDIGAKIAELNPDNQEVKEILGNLNAGRGALETIVPPAMSPDQRTKAPVPETGGASEQSIK